MRSKQLRRAYGTIQYGHLDSEKYDSIEDYFENFVKVEIPKDTRLHAAAFAMEIGEKTSRVHIGFYIECEPLRTSTLRNAFDLYEAKHEAAFQTVRDARGSWNYCAGEGRYENKDALERMRFGEPTLYGEAEKVNLQSLVVRIMDGDNLSAILIDHPYEYAVHRARLHGFYYDYDRVLRGEPIGYLEPSGE